MGACCGAKQPAKRKRSRHPDVVDLSALSDLLHQRAAELSEQVMAGPLNNRAIPDFAERRLIEAMLFTTFSTVLTIIVGTGAGSKTALQPTAPP